MRTGELESQTARMELPDDPYPWPMDDLYLQRYFVQSGKFGVRSSGKQTASQGDYLKLLTSMNE